MVSFLVFLMVLLVVAGGVTTLFRRHVNEEGRRRRLADELGLRLNHDFARARTTLSGEFEGTEVKVVLSLRAQGGRTTSHTHLEALGADPLVDLHADSRTGRLARALRGGEDHRIGDPAFDAAVRVRGSRLAAVAVLSAEAREAVLGHLGRGGVVEGGRILLESALHLDQPALLRAELRRLVSLRRALSPVTHAERFEDNARNDPEAGVRVSNLRLLAEADTDRATEVAAALAEHPDPIVRFTAAGLRGDHAAVRATAGDTKREAAATDPVGVARALAAAEDDAGLVDLLDGPTPARLAACRALEGCGTVQHVAALLPLSESGRENGEVRRAAIAAIAAIQHRIGPVDSGRIAVAATGGEVAVAAEAGRVSEARKLRT